MNEEMEEVQYAYERWQLKLRFTLNGVEWCVLRNPVHGGEIMARAEYVTYVPKPFTPDGKDVLRYVTWGTHVGALVTRVTDPGDHVLGVIRIDGQTGELSWVEGGPQA